MPQDTVLERALDRTPYHLSKPLFLGDVVPTIPSLFRFEDGKSHDGAGFFLRSLSMDGRPVRTQPMVALARSLGGVVFTKGRIVLVRFMNGSSVMGETLHDRIRFYPQPVVFTTPNLDALLGDDGARAQIAYYLAHPPTVATTLEEALRPGVVWPSYLPLDTEPYRLKHNLFLARSYTEHMFAAAVNSVSIPHWYTHKRVVVYVYSPSVGAYQHNPPVIGLGPCYNFEKQPTDYADLMCKRLVRLWMAIPFLNTWWMIRQIDQRYAETQKGWAHKVDPESPHPYTLGNGLVSVFHIPIVRIAHQRMALLAGLEPHLRTAVLDAG